MIVSREKHQGSFDIVHLKDSEGHTFATRLSNVFVIGKGTRASIAAEAQGHQARSFGGARPPPAQGVRGERVYYVR